MDLSVLQDLIPDVAGWLNIDPATLLLYLGVIATACNVIGRLIPDDQTGWLGKVRDVAKFIGVYTPNRVASGVSVNDVARAVVGIDQSPKVDQAIVEAATQPEALIPEVANVVVPPPVTPAFPGFKKEQTDEETDSDWIDRQQSGRLHDDSKGG